MAEPSKRTGASRAKRKRKPRAHEASDPTVGLLGSPDLRRNDYRNLLIVVGVALVVRIIFFFLYKHNNPLFYYPVMDAKEYHEWALEILSGNFWDNEVFFRAPLYPYLLALLYKVSGGSIAFAIFFQQLIGVVTALLVYLLARQFFVPRVSLLAGIVAALYWPFLYFEGDLLVVALIVCLDVFALFLITRSMRTHRPLGLIGAGVIIGISAIARPSILILLPVLPLVFYLYGRNRAVGASGRWIKQSLLVFGGAMILISPVIVRNYVIGRDIVPIASQGGVNFYIGNNPQSDGRSAVIPGTRWDWRGSHEDAVRIAEAARGRSLKPSEVSNFYFREGLKFIFGSPDRSIPLLARKFALFWAGGERSNNKYIYFFWQKSGLGEVPLPGFWLVAPLGLAGAVLLWRKRRDFWLLYLFVTSYTIGVVAFFVTARFRLPVVPVLIIFAAYAAFVLWRAFRQRSVSGWRTAVLVALCFVIVDIDFVRFREHTIGAHALSHYTLANAYLVRGAKDKAIAEYEQAMDINNLRPTEGYRRVARAADFNLGALYHGKGFCARAVPLLSRVGGNDKLATLAQRHLAECFFQLGRYSEAVDIYRGLLRGQPDNAQLRGALIETMIGQANSHKQNGDTAAAREVLNRAQSMFPNHPRIQQAIQTLGR
jgi:4-amino-4-deoxy-L-arabinose transferase-like glycosyltransferase